MKACPIFLISHFSFFKNSTPVLWPYLFCFMSVHATFNVLFCFVCVHATSNVLFCFVCPCRNIVSILCNGGFDIFFFFGGLLIGKSVSSFGERFRVFRDSNYKFYFMGLVWLTIYVQTERCITCYFLLAFF